MAQNAPILIRADCSERMGTGHVMRCLALAQAAQDEGRRIFYCMAQCSTGIAERLHAENMEIAALARESGSLEDAAATVEAAKSRNCEWIVLDGYEFDAAYQAAVKRSGMKLLVMDDLGALEHYVADIVVNQDPIADERLYRRREAYTRLLLGTDYTFLRREFRRQPRPRRDFPPVARKLLVTLGGSDPDNATETVIRSLDRAAVDAVEAIVLVGPSNPHGARLEVAARASRTSIRLLRNPPNIPELMAECELAVTAGGSTIWELAYFCVPSIVLLLAENQEAAIELLHRRGACRRLGHASRVSADELAVVISEVCRDAGARAMLSAALGATTDGLGAERVCAALRETDRSSAHQPLLHEPSRGQA